MSSMVKAQGSKHTLYLDDISFDVDSAGGRITSFRLGDLDILVGSDLDPANFGSTLWTSPQSDWGWPPPPEFDTREFSVSVETDGLTLVGPQSDALGVRLAKHFSIDRTKRAVVIEYSIENVTSQPKTYAPWEVSRVPARGLTFFPTGDAAGGSLAMTRAAGATWFLHDPEALDATGQKHVADGTGGYVAHVHAGERSVLFVKTFLDLHPERQAPHEGEVEVYGNNRYVEVEVQGPYARIEPGDSSSWTVCWHLWRLPRDVRVAVGNPALLSLAAGIAGGARRDDGATAGRAHGQPR